MRLLLRCLMGPPLALLFPFNSHGTYTRCISGPNQNITIITTTIITFLLQCSSPHDSSGNYFTNRMLAVVALDITKKNKEQHLSCFHWSLKTPAPRHQWAILKDKRATNRGTRYGGWGAYLVIGIWKKKTKSLICKAEKHKVLSVFRVNTVQSIKLSVYWQLRTCLTPGSIEFQHAIILSFLFIPKTFPYWRWQPLENFPRTVCQVNCLNPTSTYILRASHESWWFWSVFGTR